MLKFLSKNLHGKLKKFFPEEMVNEEDISWYHGSLTREKAEDILLKAGDSNESSSGRGLFLVRDSSTTVGDFVLSVLHEEGEVLNFQIRRHGEDAFFSINGETIFHGLETLVEYYKADTGEGLPVRLGEGLPGGPPPPNTRSHGRTNLLHRATEQGNFKIVSELVKSRYRNIEAKNEKGQTAVHVACRLGKENILEKLIQAGASVNCRDMYGNTPLHYACQNNFVSIVKLLLVSGANVQLRNSNTGWVGLHEAASRGHKEIVEHLLRVGAPARPRTNLKRTPAQLAEEGGYYQLAHLIKIHEGPKPKSSEEDWYHGTLSREEANTLLRDTKSNTDGRFLVRYSERSGYVLTMLYMNQVYNYVISKEGAFYVIDDGPLLDSLPHVVEHYSTLSDGLPTILQTPVKPKPKPPLPIFATMPSKGRRGARWSEGNATMPLPPKNKKGGGTSRRGSDALTSVGTGLTSPGASPPPSLLTSAGGAAAAASPCTTESRLQLPPVPPPSRSPPSKDHSPVSVFISRENLILKEVIGEGEFGEVYRAIYQRRNGTEIEVAVKTLHPDSATANRDSFLNEATLMMKLNHHCIVNLIGVTRDTSPLMVQELVPLGSMLTFILSKPELVSPDYELQVWASQIACGMEYLESNRVVHRDLAARNILLASRHQAKVSDFGLSRPLHEEKDYYRTTRGGRWPIKWYAPESYNFGTFSSASDVWSFGVTLWEMFSFGEQPFGELRGQEVIKLLESGERLSQPSVCPDDVYGVMSRCWEYAEADRPSFASLSEFFASRTNYENVRQLISETDIS